MRLERRDLAARAARDELAQLLEVHPKRLAALDRDLARLLSQRLERAQRSAAEASRDELTGLVHRTIGHRALQAEVQRSTRGGRTVSVIFADVNGLKEVNDTLGHAAGDSLLAAFGTALRGVLRPYDTGIRWGGDEFVVVLPEVDLDHARLIAERVSERFADLTGGSVTCGCAELQPGEGAASLIARADDEMYFRK
jgi:diguanylate cyclase (GGDEF)-like protein